MLSFPSTLNESKNMYGYSKGKEFASTFDIDRLRALNLTSSVPVLQELLKDQNIDASNFTGRHKMYDMNPAKESNSSPVHYESPLSLPSEALATAKDYEWVYKKQSKTLLYAKYDKKTNEYDRQDIVLHTVAPSMFNSHFGVNAIGMIPNVPLINDSVGLYKKPSEDFIRNGLLTEKEYKDQWIDSLVLNDPDVIKSNGATTAVISAYAKANDEWNKEGTGAKDYAEYKNNYETYADINEAQQRLLNARGVKASSLSNCSIRELCTLSKKPNSILGQARYKYADFMYCKDLGKVPNNRLITLRRFAHPVGDHIFEMTNPKFIRGQQFSFEQEADVGRLVAWFDTEDNKLEDIIKFSFSAKWNELNAKIDIQDGTADNPAGGLIGMFSNSMSPSYNKAVNAGIAGGNSFAGYLMAKIMQNANTQQGIGINNELLKNYDHNKVYEPKDRIASTHIYDGLLQFNNQFTLNFSYQLRGYENINPKSAFLDLIGNILEVTYKRGKFWGGARKVIGPNANVSSFKKVHNFIDDAWAKAGGFMESLFNGGINFNEMLGIIGQGLQGIANSVAEALRNPGEMISQYKSMVSNFISKSHMSEAFKGYLKNAAGRPQMLAWDSLLSGSDVGLWHVTIGNPKNPIVAMGNLILEDATITQTGPLGLDDFPTELKVSVSLKHARPRDITDIGKMYTKGLESLYKGFGMHYLSDFYKMSQAEQKKQEEIAKASAEQVNKEIKEQQAAAQEAKNNAASEKAKTEAEQAKQNAIKEEESKHDNWIKENVTGATANAEQAWKTHLDKIGENAYNDAMAKSYEKYGGTGTAPSTSTTNNKDNTTTAQTSSADTDGGFPEATASADMQLASQYYEGEVDTLGAPGNSIEDMLTYSGENDVPWLTASSSDIEARIMQSNNYSLEMLRLIQAEIA